jgi:hypothetical protein
MKTDDLYVFQAQSVTRIKVQNTINLAYFVFVNKRSCGILQSIIELTRFTKYLAGCPTYTSLTALDSDLDDQILILVACQQKCFLKFP